MTYEWDDDKDEANIKKHRVSFAEAKAFLDTGNFRMEFDESHSSEEEDRFIARGPLTVSSDLLVVIVEIVEGELSRIISARKERV